MSPAFFFTRRIGFFRFFFTTGRPPVHFLFFLWCLLRISRSCLVRRFPSATFLMTSFIVTLFFAIASPPQMVIRTNLRWAFRFTTRMRPAVLAFRNALESYTPKTRDVSFTWPVLVRSLAATTSPFVSISALIR